MQQSDEITLQTYFIQDNVKHSSYFNRKKDSCIKHESLKSFYHADYDL